MDIKLNYINKFIENKNDKENQEQLFFYLNLSLIAGEYLIDFQEFKYTISKFIDIESIYESINPENILDSKLSTDNELNDIELYNSAVKYYEELADNINDNTKVYLSKKNDYRKTIKPERLKIKYEIEKLFYEKNNLNESKAKPGYFLFLINLSLAELDEYLECNDKCLEELNVFKKYFQDGAISSISDKWQSPIIKILKDKCEYLEFKINFRKNKTLIIDNIAENAFRHFYDETISHYGARDIFGCSKFINDCCSEIDYSQVDLKAKKLHQINKYLKSTKNLKNKAKIEKITDIISQVSFNEKEVDFEKVSYDSVSNLLQNTKLYLVLEEEKANNFESFICQDLYKKNILATTNKIKKQIDIELERDYIDYRGYEYVIDFLNELFDKLQNFQISDEDFENVNIENLKVYFITIKGNVTRLMKFYEDILLKLENNKKHLNTLELKPIYLELDDCIKIIEIKSPLKDENLEINIFLDSSYILPIDFEKIDNKIKENRLTYKIKKQLIQGGLDALLDLESAKLKLNEVESKFKENDFKIVQIVAMFVSIATFVLINVKIFDNKSGFESIAIIFGLGGVFTLFNGFFNWLILGQIKNDHRNKKDYFSKRIFVTSGILVIISIAMLLFHNGESLIKKVDKNLNSKIDSIVNMKSNKIIEKYKEDSIKMIIEKKELENRIKILESK